MHKADLSPERPTLVSTLAITALVTALDGDTQILNLGLLRHGHLRRDTVLSVPVADHVLVAIKKGLTIVDCCLDVDAGRQDSIFIAIIMGEQQ